jgi:septal ring-binding cell division protein DamX
MSMHSTQRRGPGRLAFAVLCASLLVIAATPITTPMAPDLAMPILGRTVYGSSGDTVGRVVDVLVDRAGLPQAAVLDVGGFLGVGNRVIAVHWGALRFNPSDKDHPITISMPADEIKAAPEYTDTTAPAQVVVPHATPAPAAPAATQVAIPAPATTTPANPAGSAGASK